MVDGLVDLLSAFNHVMDAPLTVLLALVDALGCLVVPLASVYVLLLLLLLLFLPV